VSSHNHYRENVVRVARDGALAANTDEVLWDGYMMPTTIHVLEISENNSNNIHLHISPYDGETNLLDTIWMLTNNGSSLLYSYRPDTLNANKSALFTEDVYAPGTYKAHLSRDLYFPWGCKVELNNGDAQNPHDVAVIMVLLLGRRGT
jgi:hypothetical protein